MIAFVLAVKICAGGTCDYARVCLPLADYRASAVGCYFMSETYCHEMGDSIVRNDSSVKEHKCLIEFVSVGEQ